MCSRTPDEQTVETDDRFPSGEWSGFFLQLPLYPPKGWMELTLTFREGSMHGSGRDWVGSFIIKGRYQTSDGKCWWSKRYLGRHDVSYQGYNEGKGIWGVWEIGPSWRGGFHIWPKAMGNPNEAAAVVVENERPLIITEPQPVAL